MSPEIQKIDEFFSQHFIKKTFKDLSYDDSNDVHLVQNETEAYAFDKIKDQLTNKGMCSADALYFSDGDFVNFIEFKNGNIDEKTIANCKYKGVDSKKIFRFLLTYTKYRDIDFTKVKYKYVVVINSTKNGQPSTALSISMASIAGGEIKEKLLNYLLPKLKGMNFLGVKEFYDELDAWTDVEFDNKIKKL